MTSQETSPITLRRAGVQDARELTDLAHAAKRHWGYPEKWIDHWKDDLTITPEFITANEVYVATAGDQILGCCALVVDNTRAELEHLWVRPKYIGTGIGRELFMHVRERARALRVNTLELSADPNATGFYEHLGARRIGDLHTEIEGQPRILPRMAVDLGPAPVRPS